MARRSRGVVRPRRRGSRPPPAPRPGRTPGRHRCGRAPPPRRPARSAPERTSPDPRSGRFLWLATPRPVAARATPAAVADRAARRPPRAGGASAPVSIHPPPPWDRRRSCRRSMGAIRPVRTDAHHRRCVLSHLRTRETSVCRKHYLKAERRFGRNLGKSHTTMCRADQKQCGIPRPSPRPSGHPGVSSGPSLRTSPTAGETGRISSPASLIRRGRARADAAGSSAGPSQAAHRSRRSSSGIRSCTSANSPTRRRWSTR